MEEKLGKRDSWSPQSLWKKMIGSAGDERNSGAVIREELVRGGEVLREREKERWK